MKNKQGLSRREWLLLSAYLDGQLSEREKRQVDELLQTNPASRKALEDLRRTRRVLKFTPLAKVPRNFTLNAEMVRKPILPSFSRVLRFSSAMAAILLVVVFTLDIFTGSLLMASEMPADASREMLALESEKAVVEATAQPLYSNGAQEEAGMGSGDDEPDQAYGMGGGGGDQGAAEEAESLPDEQVPSTTEEEALQAVPEEMEQELLEEGALVETQPEAEFPSREDLGVRSTESTGEAQQISLRWIEIGLGLVAILTGLAARLLKKRV